MIHPPGLLRKVTIVPTIFLTEPPLQSSVAEREQMVSTISFQFNANLDFSGL